MESSDILVLTGKSLGYDVTETSDSLVANGDGIDI